jgi:hypothetical protein
MATQVVYLSNKTYEEELKHDEEYDDLKSKKERFPQISENIPDFSLIKMSQTGKYSISKLEESTITSNEIIGFYKNFIERGERGENKGVTITDATANAGGNTISFGLNKLNVNSIEFSEKEYERLKTNVSQYNLTNVSLYNNDSLKLIYDRKIMQDIIYFDPPWGGPSYKNYKFLGLSLDEKDITEHIEKMLDENYCSLVVLKGPYNTFIKKRKNLVFTVDVNIEVGVKQKIRKYYNLFFFSKTNKSDVNLFYQNYQNSQKQKTSIEEEININPFSDVYIKNIKVQKNLTFNRNWNIYNLSYLLLYQQPQPLTMSNYKEEYYYDASEHELTEKQFVYHSVNDYFYRNKIENVYFAQCRELALFINQTAIDEIIALFSLPTDIKMKQIVRQFCMLFMIDKIIVEKKDISFEPYKIIYNGFKALINGTEYDTSIFVDGMYILPLIIPKMTIDRFEHLSSFVLTNKQGIMKFTLINDFEFGDLCPGIYRCLIDNIMNYLSEKFIAFQQKTRATLVKSKNFKKHELSFNDAEEIIAVFMTNSICKITEYDTDKRIDLFCPKGSVLVLRRAAFLSQFEVVPQSRGKEEVSVLLYY